MLIYHSDLPGRLNIEKEDFTVFSSRDEAIKESEWSRLVLPGIQITLAVNILLQASTSENMNCPRCLGMLDRYDQRTLNCDLIQCKTW